MFQAKVVYTEQPLNREAVIQSSSLENPIYLIQKSLKPETSSPKPPAAMLEISEEQCRSRKNLYNGHAAMGVQVGLRSRRYTFEDRCVLFGFLGMYIESTVDGPMSIQGLHKHFLQTWLRAGNG